MSVDAWALIRGYCFKCQSSLGQQLMRCKCGASCLNTAPDKVMQAMLLRPNFHVTNKHDMCANILIGNHLIYKQGWSNYIAATTLLRSSNCRLFERMLWQTHTHTHARCIQWKWNISCRLPHFCGCVVVYVLPNHDSIVQSMSSATNSFFTSLVENCGFDGVLICVHNWIKKASNRNHVNASWWFLEVIPADFHLQFEA